MRNFTVFILLLLCGLSSTYGQDKKTVRGIIFNELSFLPVDDVNVINVTKIKGTVSRLDGTFQIEADLNDSIHFSYPGYIPMKLKVTHDWLKGNDIKIYLTEKTIELDEIIIPKYQLTGYLEADTKLIELNRHLEFSINQNKNQNYLFGTAALGSFFSPVDAVYSVFKGKTKNLKKLEAIKEDQNMIALLQTRYDRETVCALLDITREEIIKTLKNCNHSDRFIYTATDFQIYQALNECFEQSKILTNKT